MTLSYRQPFVGVYAITQEFGEKVTSKFHTGIDYACPLGTQIIASCDGIIQQIGYDENGYGHYIIIRPTGTVIGILCAHLSEVLCVQNQEVAQGDLIGLSGNSGNSTGAHLHFEVRSQWDKADSYFSPYSLPLIMVTTEPVVNTAEKTTFIAETLPDNISQAIVSAPDGANLRDEYLNWIGVIYPGTTIDLSGEKRTDGKIVRRAVVIRGWLAENDGETQILTNKS